MAAPTKAGSVPRAGDGDSALITWALTSADPVGDAVAYVDYADRTVVGQGTFGTATLQFQGSLDGGTTWFVLTDPQGNNISKTAAFLEAISEAVPLIRATLSTPGAGATVTAILYARRAR